MMNRAVNLTQIIMKRALIVFAAGTFCFLLNTAPAQQRALDQKELQPPPPRVIGEKESQKGLSGATSLRHKSEINRLLAQYRGKQRETDQKMTELKKKLESAMKDLEAQDKMGNFEIQNLMSTLNQAETLSSSVRKKLDETANQLMSKL